MTTTRRVFGGAAVVAACGLVLGGVSAGKDDPAPAEVKESKGAKAVAAHAAAVTLIGYGRENKDALAVLGGVKTLVKLAGEFKYDDEKAAKEATDQTKEMLQTVLAEAAKFAGDDLKPALKTLEGDVAGLGQARGTPAGGGAGRAWVPLISAKLTTSKAYLFEAKPQLCLITVSRTTTNPNAPIKVVVTDPAGNVVAPVPGTWNQWRFYAPAEQNYKVTITNNDTRAATAVSVVTN